MTSFKEASEALEKVKIKYEELNKKKKSCEHGLEEIEINIKKLKERIKDIKTNKEYNAHLKEIESAEKNKYQIEEEILSIMESIEILTGGLKEEDRKIKIVEENLKHEEKALEDEGKALYSEIEAYKAKRKDLEGLIKNGNEELYEKYTTLLITKDGIAVVETSNEVCKGCHTNIPPQLYNDIKNNHGIFSCYNCNRILYCKSEEGKESG